MPEYVQHINNRVERLRRNSYDRDARMKAIRLIRTGHADQVFKGVFPSDWPKPVIANFIDVVAKDTAEMVGVLPTLTAAGDSVLDESKRSRTDKQTRILNYLAFASSLGTELVTAADRLVSYGFVPFRVEPNYKDERPHIHIEDPTNAYFEKDSWGELVRYAKVMSLRASELAAMYPEFEQFLVKNTAYSSQGDEWLDVVRHIDRERDILYVPRRDGLVLSSVDNVLGKIPISIAKLPSLDGDTRGQFDDVMWVYAAKARLALLSLEATQKAVEAPIALPQDVQEFAFGPDAILRSQSPERIRRVGLELPQSALVTESKLDEELKMGARFPEARAGQVDGSVVTGRGVQALMGGFDQRIKVAQSMLGSAVSDALSIAMEMDEKIWPNTRKDVYASVNGSPYQLKYTPSKDIKGNYTVTHEYGVMAGLDPNRALVWGLQALGANLISKSFLRRNLPVNMNVTEEEKVIDVEKLREAAMMSVQQYAQTLPMIAQQGGDPQAVIKVISTLIDERKKGTPIEDAIGEAFQPPEVSPAEQVPGPAAAEAQPPGAGVNPGGGPPPQQNMQQLLSGLSSQGRPQMSARTMRQTPIA